MFNFNWKKILNIFIFIFVRVGIRFQKLQTFIIQIDFSITKQANTKLITQVGQDIVYIPLRDFWIPKLTMWAKHSSYVKIKPQSKWNGIIRDCIIKRLHYKKNEMSTPLKSEYNSSYQAKTEASDIIQSRRTSGEVRETPHVSPLYITSCSKVRTKGMKMTTLSQGKTDEPDRPEWTVHLPQPGHHTKHCNLTNKTFF